MTRKLLYLIPFAILVLLLASCGTPTAVPSPTAAPTPTQNPVAGTQALAQRWVDAYHALDADMYMSLFAPTAVYYDMSLKDFGAYTRDALDRAVHGTFNQPGFKVTIDSFFVSPDGKRAALEGTYYDLNKAGIQVGMPMVTLLEIQDGMIMKETDYYDRGPLR
jgi:hypothetical protein